VRQCASEQTAAEAMQEHALATRQLHAAQEQLREANERGDALQAAVQQLTVEKRVWVERESAHASQLRDAAAAAAAAAAAEWRGTAAAEATRVRVCTYAALCVKRALAVRAGSLLSSFAYKAETAVSRLLGALRSLCTQEAYHTVGVVCASHRRGVRLESGPSFAQELERQLGEANRTLDAMGAASLQVSEV
jgi:hypothetical protein